MKYFLIIILFYINFNNSEAMNNKPQPLDIQDVNFPEYKVRYLSNSLKIIIIENRKQPYIYFKMITGGGVATENKPGVAELTSNLLLKGSKNYTNDEISEKLDIIGSNLFFITNQDYNWVYGAVLRKYLDEFLDIYSDIYINPGFNAKEFEKLKNRTKSALQAMKSNPDTLSENLMRKILYGDKHNYGKILTEAILDSIKIEDIKNYYGKVFHPNNSTLAVSGDVDEEKLMEMLEIYFGSWKKSDVAETNILSPNPHKGKYFFIERDSSKQTNLKIGALTTDFKSSDRLKLLLASQYLGNSFSGRLFKVLREENNYSYNPNAHIRNQKRFIPFICNADINSDSVFHSVELIHNELNEMEKGNIDTALLELTKQNFTGNLMINTEDPFFIMSTIQIYEYMLEDVYDLERIVTSINSITAEDIKIVMKKYLSASQRKTIITGDKSVKNQFLDKYNIYLFDKEYNEKGKNQIVYSIDGLTPDSLINNYLSASGGTKNIENVNTLITYSDATVYQNKEVHKGEFIRKQKTGGFMYQNLSFGLVEQKIWVNPDSVFLSYKTGNITEADSIMAEEYRRQAKIFNIRDLLKNGTDNISEFRKSDNNIVLGVFMNQNEISYFFDYDTGLLNKIELSTNGNKLVINYSNYFETHNLYLPGTEEAISDNLRIIFKHSYKINDSIEDDFFKP